MTCLTFSKLLEAALVGPPGCKFAAVHFRSALAEEDFLAAASTALAFAGAAETAAETADEFSPPPKAAPPEITALSLLSLISLVT